MNLQYIAAVGIVVVLAVVAVAAFAPKVIDKVPGINNVLHSEVYANVSVVANPAANQLVIVDIALEDKIPFTVVGTGPFMTVHEGRIVYQSYNTAGTLVDSVEQSYAISGWTGSTSSGLVRLGKTGSGAYTIKVSMLDQNGTTIAHDQAIRVI